MNTVWVGLNHALDKIAGRTSAGGDYLPGAEPCPGASGIDQSLRVSAPLKTQSSQSSSTCPTALVTSVRLEEAVGVARG